jgi:hypothetical protein
MDEYHWEDELYDLVGQKVSEVNISRENVNLIFENSKILRCGYACFGDLEQRYDPGKINFPFCECGHSYERHFDPYEHDDFDVHCKYCDCRNFRELKLRDDDVAKIKEMVLNREGEKCISFIKGLIPDLGRWNSGDIEGFHIWMYFGGDPDYKNPKDKFIGSNI